MVGMWRFIATYWGVWQAANLLDAECTVHCFLNGSITTGTISVTLGGIQTLKSFFCVKEHKQEKHGIKIIIHEEKRIKVLFLFATLQNDL
jgi:hypothetical protein